MKGTLLIDDSLSPLTNGWNTKVKTTYIEI